jgi:hypothetical protein
MASLGQSRGSFEITSEQDLISRDLISSKQSMLRASAFPVPNSVSNLMDSTSPGYPKKRGALEYKSRSILSNDDQANQFMKTNGAGEMWESIQQLQNVKEGDSPSNKRPLTAYYNSIRLQKKSGAFSSTNLGSNLGIRSERVASNKVSLKEASQAMQEISKFEKTHGLKKLGPPVNKYP